MQGHTYMHTHMCRYIYARRYIYTYILKSTHAQIDCVCTWRNRCTCIYKYTGIYACMSIHIHIYTLTHAHRDINEHMHTETLMHVYIPIYKHMYIYTDTCHIHTEI